MILLTALLFKLPLVSEKKYDINTPIYTAAKITIPNKKNTPNKLPKYFTIF